MKFTELELEGVYLIVLSRHEDERGYFVRTWCRREFEAHGLSTEVVQRSASFTRLKGTIRGIHYQIRPHRETKLVRCESGRLFDVVVDLRETSPTFGRTTTVILPGAGDRMVYIPKGCGHGYQTLEANTQVSYLMGAYHEPESARGIAWNDARLNIDWPLAPANVNQRDRDLPALSDAVLPSGRPLE